MINAKFLKRVVLLFLLAAVASLGSAGCGGAEPEARVLFIGLDGIEMNVLRPLLERGELPNLAGLIDRGVFGFLRTFKPTYSPVVWTSIATGKSPEEHNIYHFLDKSTNGPFTSNARRGKAIWNIVGDYGLRCNVTGYWITYPAEKIEGIMISQVTSMAQYDDIWKGMLYKDVKGATYPEEFLQEIWPVVEPFQTQEFIEKEIWPQVFSYMEALNASEEVSKLISDSNWSFAGDYMYLEAAKYLLDRYPADLDIVYLGGTDVTGHRFWRYREPDIYKYRIMPKYIEAFGDAIDNYYRLTDRMVGELLDRVPENTRVIIVSDHGMHPDFLDGKDANQKRTILSAHHLDAPDGIIIAAGDGIRKGPGLAAYLKEGNFEQIGTVLDVTPTLLYLLDVPLGRDMRMGRVMKKVVRDELLASRPIQHVETHDVDFRPPTSSRSSRDANQAFIKNFAELGYIDDSGTGTGVPKYRMGPAKKE